MIDRTERGEGMEENGSRGGCRAGRACGHKME